MYEYTVAVLTKYSIDRDRFGVHWVNFTDPERPRIAKDSVATLTKIFADNGFPQEN
jgi:hypothetical protein